MHTENLGTQVVVTACSVGQKLSLKVLSGFNKTVIGRATTAPPTSMFHSSVFDQGFRHVVVVMLLTLFLILGIQYITRKLLCSLQGRHLRHSLN